MPLDFLAPLIQHFPEIALATIIVAALYYVLLVPRKGPNSEVRSPLLVIGSSHDAAIEECRRSGDERVKFYEDLLKTERLQSDQQVQQWRSLREEEKVRAVEADERLAENSRILGDLSRDLKEARLDLARAVALLGQAKSNV